MSIISAIILGLIQALTEFLPVSSSGHLVVVQVLLKDSGEILPESMLGFDVLIHFATLIVIFSYLRKELIFYAKNAFRSSSEFWKFSWPFALGFLPGGLVGGVVLLFFKEVFESISFVACGFIVTGIILELAHRKSSPSQGLLEESKELQIFTMPTPRQALIIGLFQALAVLPGISRSGSTVGAALMLGLSKQTALKFSFLISIPLIIAATLVQIPDLLGEGKNNYPAFAFGFFTSLVFGFLAIKLLEIFVKGSKLRWFAIYVFCLGIFLHSI